MLDYDEKIMQAEIELGQTVNAAIDKYRRALKALKIGCGPEVAAELDAGLAAVAKLRAALDRFYDEAADS